MTVYITPNSLVGVLSVTSGPTNVTEIYNSSSKKLADFSNTGLKLYGSTSGYTELTVPAVAGTNSFTFPSNVGAAASVLSTDGTGVLSWRSPLIQMTAQSVSGLGTAVDFIGIPSWVKRITVMFERVSISASQPQIQLGTSSGFEGANYTASTFAYNSGTNTTSTTGLITDQGGNPRSGSYVINLQSPSTNTWVGMGVLHTGQSTPASGVKSCSNTVDRIRVTTVNGAATFSSGTINVMYE